jgi:hypothetical protein
MAQIVFPASASNQGHAFEDLILSYYHKVQQCSVREWSTYLHGKSGTWWQCDGIVEDSKARYLVEAKFFRDRPAYIRDIDPARRQAAAQDLDCTGILYISLNGFTNEMLAWPHAANLDVHFISWSDLRSDILGSFQNCASVLLDSFDLTSTQATAVHSGSALHFDSETPSTLSTRFPEFIIVPDAMEQWLRRMPSLSVQMAQITAGKFWYSSSTGQVTLVADRASDLSLQEAWEIQDTLSGYASRVYTAVRATAEALSIIKEGLLEDVKNALHAAGWTTGNSGVRDSLNFLVQLGIVRKWMDQRKAHYALLPLGQAYTAGGINDGLFADILKEWPPYSALCHAIVRHGIPATPDGIVAYFKNQYKPYEPYARSLFNPNKSEGLLKLFKQFEH